MLYAFMGYCSPNAAFHAVTSLNDPESSDGTDDIGDDQEVGDSIVDPTIDIEGDFAHRRLVAELRRFVYGLSPHLRCIVFRHYWLGHSQSQIAADLGVTRSAVCHALRRVHRLGRTHLAQLAA